MRGHTAEQTDCTMLFVDGGFPIDVIFYASVWGRRERKEREQGERAHREALHSDQHPSATQTETLQKESGTPQVTPRPHTSDQASPSPNATTSSWKGVDAVSGQRHHGAPADPDSPLSPARSREGDIVFLVFTWLWEKQTHRIVGICKPTY